MREFRLAILFKKCLTDIDIRLEKMERKIDGLFSSMPETTFKVILPLEQSILQALEEHGRQNTITISKRVGKHRSNVSSRLNTLSRRGLVAKYKRGKLTEWELASLAKKKEEPDIQVTQLGSLPILDHGLEPLDDLEKGFDITIPKVPSVIPKLTVPVHPNAILHPEVEIQFPNIRKSSKVQSIPPLNNQILRKKDNE